MIERLVLGTAQFGFDYGRNNKRGKIGADEVYEILRYAYESGITKLDTANAYGESEAVLGRYLSTNTYLQNHFEIITKSAEPGELLGSLNRLRTKSVYGYLAHDFQKYLETPAIWNYWQECKNNGSAKKVGFSVYNFGDIDYLFDNKIQFDMIQLPYSLLDYGFSLYLNELKRLSIEIYARSVFMQGRVFMNQPDDKIEAIMQSSLYFCLRDKRLDYVVVGIDNLDQLKQIVKAVNSMPKGDA